MTLCVVYSRVLDCSASSSWLYISHDADWCEQCVQSHLDTSQNVRILHFVKCVHSTPTAWSGGYPISFAVFVWCITATTGPDYCIFLDSLFLSEDDGKLRPVIWIFLRLLSHGSSLGIQFASGSMLTGFVLWTANTQCSSSEVVLGRCLTAMLWDRNWHIQGSFHRSSVGS